MPTFLIIVNRLSNAARGALLLFVIVAFVGSEMQGLLFAFLSLGALAAVLELGFSRVVMQVMSHESAHVKFGSGLEPAGEPRFRVRVLGFVRFALRVYVVVAAAAGSALALVGMVFFGNEGRDVVLAWFLFCGGVVFKLVFEAALALIEGANHVSESQRLLLVAQLVSTLGVALMIALGYGVWALAWGTLAGYGLGLALVVARAFPLWRAAIKEGKLDGSPWFGDLWGLQWRYAISWACGAAVLNLAVPATFKIEGPVAAGQLGLSQAICLILVSLSTATLYARTPTLGSLVARGRLSELNLLFRRYATICYVLYFILALATGVLLHVLPDSLAHRLLPGAELLAVVLAYGGYLVITVLGSFVRAHLVEPFYKLALIQAVVVPVILLGFMPSFGLLAALVAMAVSHWAVFVPIALVIYVSVRRAQHKLIPATGRISVG